MAFYALSAWRTTMQNELPNGANLNATVMSEALRNAVAYCGTWVRDVQRADFVGDGFTFRFALPGVDVELAPADQQETPISFNTAGIAAPTATATITASGAASTFVAGLHYGSYALTTPLGQTPIIATYSSVTTTTGQNIVFPAITLPTGATGVNYYVSPGPLNADIRLAGTGTGTLKTFTAPPLATAARPFAAYQPLVATYAPVRDVEQDIAVDGTATVGTATLTMTTVPALGARFRVVYTCAPAVPQADTDIIRVPEQIFREAAVMACANRYAYLHESGDQTMWLSLFDRADALVMDMQKKDLPRLRPRPRIVEEV